MSPAKRPDCSSDSSLWAQAALILYGFLPTTGRWWRSSSTGFRLEMIWGWWCGIWKDGEPRNCLLAGLQPLHHRQRRGQGLRTRPHGGYRGGWWNAVPVVGAWIGSALGRVSEGWMPASRVPFLPIFLASVWLLTNCRVPVTRMGGPRSANPCRARTGFAFVTVCLWTDLPVRGVLLPDRVRRDYRDNYQVEIPTAWATPTKPTRPSSPRRSRS